MVPFDFLQQISGFTKCLTTNFFVWATVYGAAYYLLYHRYKTKMKKYKFSSKYPARNVILKEITLSAVGIIICSYYESMILFHKNQEWKLLNDQFLALPTLKEKAFSIVGNIISLKTAAMLLWIDGHFYFYHRLCHIVPVLYRYIHYLHHESRNVDPWSGLSFHPIESMLYFSSLFGILVPFMKGTPYWLFILYKLGVMIAPLNGHSGMGNTLDAQVPGGDILNSFDHYIHHVLYNYNYGSGLFPIWDNIMGTKYQVSQMDHFQAIRQKRQQSNK